MPQKKKRASLAALLGGEEVEKVTLSGSRDADFCHNCANFIEHPFRTRCGLTGDTADPMGSCSKFTKRS